MLTLATLTDDTVTEWIMTFVFVTTMPVGGVTAYVIYRRRKGRLRQELEESRRFSASAEPWGKNPPRVG